MKKDILVVGYGYVGSSPGSTGAFQVSSERLEMLQKEVEQIEPVLIPNPYNTFIRG